MSRPVTPGTFRPVGGVLLLCALAAGARCQSPFVAPPDTGARLPADEILDSIGEWSDAVLIEVEGAGTRCAIRLDDGRLLEVVGVGADDSAIVVTPRGRIEVDAWLGSRGVFAEMLARIGSADGMPAPGAHGAPTDHDATLDYHPLLGWVIRAGDERAFGPDGRFTIEATPDARSEDFEAVVAALDALDARPALLRDEQQLALFRELVQRCLEDDTEVEYEDLRPSAIRRMIRHGWLVRALGDVPRARTLTAAVVQASVPRPVATWRSADVTIECVRDAFGRLSWIERKKERTRIAVRAPRAEFGELDWNFPDDGWVVITLAAGTDPLGAFPFAAVEAAHFDESATTIASWSRDGGFTADDETWREEVPIEWLVSGQAATDDYLPPHLVVTDILGDVAALVVAHGIVEPHDRSPEQSLDAYLDAVARTLPDPAHLDLLGQYLVDYAHDGIQLGRPDLPGTAAMHGDHHQTVAETFASERGGVCIGDCDDLAEIYVALFRRQGRHALPLGVPGHMFAAAAEPTADGFVVHVLQTGPAESHRGADLPMALSAALRSQDPTSEPDPLAVEAWPRIDARPLRTLAWVDANALRDAARAAHVLEHARADQRGLFGATAVDRRADLERHLAAAGPTTSDFETAALHTRLAEALRRIGDHDGAATHAMAAAALVRTPGARVPRLVHAIGDAIATGDAVRIASHVRDLEWTIDAWAATAPPIVTTHAVAMAIEALLVARDGGAVAAQVAERLGPDAMRRLIAAHATMPNYPVSSLPAADDALGVLDRLAESLARTTSRTADERIRTAIAATLRDWRTFTTEQDAFGTWSYHAAIDATLARDGRTDFVDRLADAGVQVDRPSDGASPWPWYAGVVETWTWEIERNAIPGRPLPDATEIRRLVRGLDRAVFARQRAGVFDELDREMQFATSVYAGILMDDIGRVRAALFLAQSFTPDFVPDLADTIASTVTRVPAERYELAVRAWLDAPGRATDAFRIAWATRAAGDRERAIAVARLVVGKFADPEFLREYDLMVALPR